MAYYRKATTTTKVGRYSLRFSTLELSHARGSRDISRASAVGLILTLILALRASNDPSAPVFPPSATKCKTGSGTRDAYSEFELIKDLVSTLQLDMHIKTTNSPAPAPGAAKPTQLGRQTFRNVAGRFIKKLGLKRACTCGELLAAMRACDQVFAFTFGAAGQGEAKGLRSLRLSEMVQIVENGCIDLTDSPSRDNAIELHLRNMPGVELPAAPASPASPATPASLEHYGTNSLAHCENGNLLLNTLTPAATAAPAAPASTRDNYMGVHQMAGSTFAQTVGMATFNMPAGQETLFSLQQPTTGTNVNFMSISFSQYTPGQYTPGQYTPGQYTPYCLPYGQQGAPLMGMSAQPTPNYPNYPNYLPPGGALQL